MRTITNSISTIYTGTNTWAVILISALIAGCSKQEEPPDKATTSPLLVIAANERGRPQFDYSGPDSMSYRYSLDTFTFQLGPVGGQPWATGKGHMKLGRSNDVAVRIESSSQRAYELQLLGLSPTNDMEIAEDNAKETIQIKAGSQEFSIQRFIIFTYDFSKR